MRTLRINIFMAIHFPENKVTFIHIPKTAGSSFEQWIRDNNIVHHRQQKHCTLQDAKNIWSNLGYTFCFVRNPYARMVSMFHFIGQRAIERIEMRKQGQRTKKSTNQQDDILIAEYYNKGFENWLEEHSQDIKNPFDLGIWMYERKTPQVFWIDETVTWFKAEELSLKFKNLQEIFNINVPLPHTNKTSHKHYREYYNDNTKQIIEKLFKDDLNRFNYDY